MENIEEHVRNCVDLSNGDFRGRTFDALRLRRARFAKCDFTNASLYEADLFKADMKGAVLVNVDLRFADLAGADLTGANLTGARLEGAAIEATELTDCIGIIDAGCDPRGYRFIGVKRTDGWMIKAGCRWFSFDNATAHWTDRGNTDALERVDTIIEAASRL